MDVTIGKYKNWRTSIEGDYFSLYIKTWFSFLSTLHELYPEKINSIGDGGLIKHSADNMQVPHNYDTEIAPAIKLMFISAESLMKSEFEDYYFSSFYELNKVYRFKDKNIDGHISLTVTKTKEIFPATAVGTRRRQKDKMYFEIRSTQIQFLNHLKPIVGENSTYTLNTNVDLGKIIRDKNYDDKFQIINLAKSQIYEQIGELFTARNHTDIQKEKAFTFFQNIIELSFQHWAQNFDIDKLFKKMPSKDYPNTEHSKRQTLKWFIKYSYKLRNVLFHIIIDPFDKDWQPIYKNTYIALKELVDENIRQIEATAEENANT